MKITQDVRDYARQQNERVGEAMAEIQEELGAIDPQAGMDEMSARFKDMGGELYLDAETVKKANEALG
jgi:phosphomethylpyrimidine synthase